MQINGHPKGASTSASPGLHYSQVDIQGLRYTAVNYAAVDYAAETSPVSPKCCDQISLRQSLWSSSQGLCIPLRLVIRVRGRALPAPPTGACRGACRGHYTAALEPNHSYLSLIPRGMFQRLRALLVPDALKGFVVLFAELSRRGEGGPTWMKRSFVRGRFDTSGSTAPLLAMESPSGRPTAGRMRAPGPACARVTGEKPRRAPASGWNPVAGATAQMSNSVAIRRAVMSAMVHEERQKTPLLPFFEGIVV